MSRDQKYFGFICFLLAFLPFLHAPFLFNGYELPKFFIFVVATYAIAICYFFKLGRKFSLHGVPVVDSFTLIVIGYILVVFIADIFGIDTKVSLLGSLYRHQGFVLLLSCVLLFITIRSLQIEKTVALRAFTSFITVGTAFLVGIGILQGIGVYILHSKEIITYQGRIIATLGNPNFLGGYLVMVLPFILFRHSGSEERNSSRFWILKLVQDDKMVLRFIFILGILVVIFFTQSRSGFIAVGVIFLFYFYKILKRLLYKRLFIAIIFLTLHLIIFFAIRQAGLVEMTKIFSQRDSIWDNRMLIWNEGIKKARERPVLGYGQENFELVFPQERHMKVDSAHNIFLETIISSGVIGLVLFAAIIYYGLLKADYPVRLSIIAFLIIAQFNPLSIAQIVFFWFLLGLIKR